MSDALRGLMEATIWFALIFLLTALGLALVRRFRGRNDNARPDSHAMMTNFRDLYERGGLSDSEFRTIKSKLADEVKAELNDNGNRG
jgi:uncharacterized membrane protein